jgi:hypothetical protein
MSKFFLAASLVAVVAVAACSAAPIEPSSSPSVPPVVPTAAPSGAPPSDAPPSDAPPAATPRPTTVPVPASPGSLEDFTPQERYLFDGIRRGATECQPAGGSDELPRDAIAGVECFSDDPGVARIGFYLFENDADMLDAYKSRMQAEGVALESGNCRDGEHEGAYTPGEGEIASRHGCFINEEGYANYRATQPGWHVYIGILGSTDDMPYLEDFAWRGNQDVPGNPTLWAAPN